MPDTPAILHATDLSEASDHAFGHARYLAERLGAQLTVYHALELGPRRAADRGVDETRLAEIAEREARDHLDGLLRGLAVRHEVVIERDVAVPALADVAVLHRIAQQQPDLTVVATHSREGVATYFIGTVAERVIREARRAVLVVHKGRRDETFPYRRLLVTTDLSPASRTAWSRRLARELPAELLALHVAGRAAADADEVARRADTLRQFLAPDHDGVAVRLLAAHGTAWREIVAAAEREDVDVIVMATRGHDSLRDELLGSHADRVIRYAPCPVLVAG
jgi:nucleotide-binding universal stress UspA family protein